MKVEIVALLLLLFNTGLSEEYRITYTIRDHPRAGITSSDVVSVSVKGTDGQSNFKPFAADLSSPGRSVSFIINSKSDIGKFTCLIIKIRASVESMFTRLKVQKVGTGETRYFVPDEGWGVVKYGDNEFCFDKTYPTGFPQEEVWLPDFERGNDALDDEYGFFYWLFQSFIIPIIFLVVIMIFGIIACVRGKVCPCCNKGKQTYGNESLIRVQAQ